MDRGWIASHHMLVGSVNEIRKSVAEPIPDRMEPENDDRASEQRVDEGRPPQLKRDEMGGGERRLSSTDVASTWQQPAAGATVLDGSASVSE